MNILLRAATIKINLLKHLLPAPELPPKSHGASWPQSRVWRIYITFIVSSQLIISLLNSFKAVFPFKLAYRKVAFTDILKMIDEHCVYKRTPKSTNDRNGLCSRFFRNRYAESCGNLGYESNDCRGAFFRNPFLGNVLRCFRYGRWGQSVKLGIFLFY